MIWHRLVGNRNYVFVEMSCIWYYILVLLAVQLVKMTWFRRDFVQSKASIPYRSATGFVIPSEVTFSTFRAPFSLGEIGKRILPAPQAEKCNKNEWKHTWRCPEQCSRVFSVKVEFPLKHVRSALKTWFRTSQPPKGPGAPHAGFPVSTHCRNRIWKNEPISFVRLGNAHKTYRKELVEIEIESRWYNLRVCIYVSFLRKYAHCRV